MGERRSSFLWILAILLIPVVVVAASDREEQAREKAVIEIAAEVKQAIKDGNQIALSEACSRAETLRPNCEVEQFQAVVREVIKGIKNKDTGIAIVSVRTLGHLDCPGTSKHIVGLLSPPKKPSDERLRLHLCAIEAAGELHEPACARKLEKLIQHPETDFAVAATKALGDYAEVDRKTRRAMVQRLVDVFGRLEKKRGKTAVQRAHIAVVRTGLRDCLRKLTKEPSIENSEDVRKWLRTDPQTAKAS